MTDLNYTNLIALILLCTNFIVTIVLDSLNMQVCRYQNKLLIKRNIQTGFQLIFVDL